MHVTRAKSIARVVSLPSTHTLVLVLSFYRVPLPAAGPFARGQVARIVFVSESNGRLAGVLLQELPRCGSIDVACAATAALSHQSLACTRKRLTMSQTTAAEDPRAV